MHHLPAVIQALTPVINKYGYVAVGGLILLEDFGIPAPGETVLIAAAFYAGLGQLNLPLVILVGFIGAVLGDNIGFAIGQYGGLPLIERFGSYLFVTPERIHKARDFFKRHGGKVVAGARFIEGLRQLNGIIAGLSDMRWLKFITFNAIGAALWVSCWALIGYLAGNHIETFLRYQLYITIAALLFVAAYVIFRALQLRRR
jgi:membrane protein DedA with SNARE-associated domain